MISYKYKLYRSKRNKRLEKMLGEAAFVWNHALALQKRYYAIFGKYILCVAMQKHFAKRLKPHLLHSQTQQEILQRLDTAYQRFFKHIATRPPKFKRASDFSSFVFKQGGYTLFGNKFTINKLKQSFKFSLSRPYEGTVKRVLVKRTPLKEFYIIVLTDANPKSYRKSRNGASVGIDFGLKTYMTLSDGETIQNPQFLKGLLSELKQKSKNFSRCELRSHNKEYKRLSLCRLHKLIHHKREDFQWKLAHYLCEMYDFIFLEDLTLCGMTKLWGRKMCDLAHGEFVHKLTYVATKYNVTVHKIDKWFASSKTCECGFVNKELLLSEREWVCPACGCIHDRDLLAANNILRKGISELESGSKTCLASVSR